MENGKWFDVDTLLIIIMVVFIVVYWRNEIRSFFTKNRPEPRLEDDMDQLMDKALNKPRDLTQAEREAVYKTCLRIIKDGKLL